MQTIRESLDERTPTKDVPTVSAVFKDGTILEMLYNADARQTRFACWRDGTLTIEDSFRQNAVYRLVPYSGENNLITNEVVLLPSVPEDYGSEHDLFAAIKDFIHRHVDVSPLYEDIASYYVMFSWVYDRFNELPYLRVRGDPGCGKTRFLLTVGSLCYKAIFASGGSTVSPLFRTLETFRGTLVIDESDLRFSDEKAEFVKILNNGNVQGFPVLRSDTNGKGEFNPRAYHVFGPKLVATRGDFEDRALESRFLTEEMGMRRLRHGIPINLDQSYKAEARTLRNKLLMFRFHNLHKHSSLADLVDPMLEPRMNQIFTPLLSIVDDPKAREQLRAVARQSQRDLISERGLSIEAQVLEIIQELVALPGARLSIKEIAERFADLHADDYKHTITAKWIGSIVRKRLHLSTAKSHGSYSIPESDRPKLDRLFERYGLIDVVQVQTESQNPDLTRPSS